MSPPFESRLLLVVFHNQACVLLKRVGGSFLQPIQHGQTFFSASFDSCRYS
uniref:Uncharacterized protein n=1 Tax=Peronospora matthiolae TaxID=2874970 RepID=A0AAV1TML5_9STRA